MVRNCALSLPGIVGGTVGTVGGVMYLTHVFSVSLYAELVSHPQRRPPGIARQSCSQPPLFIWHGWVAIEFKK